MVVIIPRPDDPGAVQENVVIIYTESAAGNYDGSGQKNSGRSEPVISRLSGVTEQ